MSRTKKKKRNAHTIAREHNRKPAFKTDISKMISDTIYSTCDSWSTAAGFTLIFYAFGVVKETLDKNFILLTKIGVITLGILAIFRLLISYGSQHSTIVDFFFNGTYDDTVDAGLKLLSALILSGLMLGAYIYLM